MLQSQSYFYSRKTSGLALVVATLFLMLFIYVIISITKKSGVNSGLIFFPFAFTFIIFVVYITKKFYLPAIADKTALIIDSKKIIYNIDNKTIYWNEISDVKTRSGVYDFVIVLQLYDQREILISTRYVKGDHNEIFDSIMTHLSKKPLV